MSKNEASRLFGVLIILFRSCAATFCFFSNIAMVRYELFVKSSEELRSIIPVLKHNGVTKVNLPNKGKNEETKKFFDLLKQESPDIDVCVHWSVKYRKLKSVDMTHENFASVCESNLDRLLIVSGSKPAARCNSLTCLQYLSSSLKKYSTPIGVAFNPYIPTVEGVSTEEQRLLEKLRTNVVSSVWLQCGSNVSALKNGLLFLEELRRSGFNFDIIGSLLIPSRRLLAQMKFRPWSGVILGADYLSSVDAADAITREIVAVYAKHGVEPLIETACLSQADFDRVAQLIHPLAEPSSSQPCDVLPRDADGPDLSRPHLAEERAAPPRRKRPCSPQSAKQRESRR